MIIQPRKEKAERRTEEPTGLTQYQAAWNSVSLLADARNG